LLVPGYDLASSRAAVALAATHPGLVQAAVGIHPHFAARTADHDWVELGELVRAPGVVAVGEIGLDFFRNLSPPDLQRRAFGHQLELAAAAGLPVIVHDREAHGEVRAALLGGPAPPGDRPRGVLHAFSGDAAMALELTGAGYLVSFALPVTFRSASGPRAAAAAVGEGTFLVETDAPWLAPGGAGQRNEPTTAVRVALELARLRGLRPDEVATQARSAYERLVAR
jgi:TatD DNase family protein